MAWKSGQTLYHVPVGLEKRSNAISCPGGPGKAFKRYIRFRTLWISFQTLFQLPEGLVKRSNALSGPRRPGKALNALSGPGVPVKSFKRFIRSRRAW